MSTTDTTTAQAQAQDDVAAFDADNVDNVDPMLAKIILRLLQVVTPQQAIVVGAQLKSREWAKACERCAVVAEVRGSAERAAAWRSLGIERRRIVLHFAGFLAVDQKCHPKTGEHVGETTDGEV